MLSNKPRILNSFIHSYIHATNAFSIYYIVGTVLVPGAHDEFGFVPLFKAFEVFLDTH